MILYCGWRTASIKKRLFPGFPGTTTHTTAHTDEVPSSFWGWVDFSLQLHVFLRLGPRLTSLYTITRIAGNSLKTYWWLDWALIQPCYLYSSLRTSYYWHKCKFFGFLNQNQHPQVNQVLTKWSRCWSTDNLILHPFSNYTLRPYIVSGTFLGTESCSNQVSLKGKAPLILERIVHYACLPTIVSKKQLKSLGTPTPPTLGKLLTCFAGVRVDVSSQPLEKSPTQ